METTITLEFFADTHAHLERVEHEFKQIHGIQVLLVMPRDLTAPALISLGIGRKAEAALPRIAQMLYAALHSPDERARKIALVTIEGDNRDITSLPEDEIERIITDAYQNQ
jgi:hypothetical protein